MPVLAAIPQVFKDLLPFLGALAGTVLVLRLVYWLAYRSRKSLRAEPNFKGQLLLIALTLVGVVAVTLTLPISEDMRGQLLGLLGVLLTAVIALSATTVVANALAGLMVRSTRSFRPGDFVRVGEEFGRVTEMGLFHTEIQTEDRDLTRLPNQTLVSQPMTVVRASGTIVSTSLSLGYDLDRRRIEPLLVEAAKTAGLEEPFVQVRALGDFSVTYRIAGFLADVTKLVSARSRLRAEVLDSLHGAGVEIVSPTFMNQRQLAAGARFIPAPPASRPVPVVDEVEPESIVFDKAEEAQRLEDLVQRHDALMAEAKALDGQKSGASKEEQEHIANQAEGKRKHAKALEQAIARLKDKEEQEPRS